MDYNIIYNANCWVKKTNEIFIYFVIENIVEKSVRDLIIEIHSFCFRHIFLNPGMNVENGCLFLCFIQVEINGRKSLGRKNFPFRHRFSSCLHLIEKFIFQFIMDLPKPVPFHQMDEIHSQFNPSLEIPRLNFFWIA